MQKLEETKSAESHLSKISTLLNTPICQPSISKVNFDFNSSQNYLKIFYNNTFHNTPILIPTVQSEHFQNLPKKQCNWYPYFSPFYSNQNPLQRSTLFPNNSLINNKSLKGTITYTHSFSHHFCHFFHQLNLFQNCFHVSDNLYNLIRSSSKSSQLLPSQAYLKHQNLETPTDQIINSINKTSY